MAGMAGDLGVVEWSLEVPNEEEVTVADQAGRGGATGNPPYHLWPHDATEPAEIDRQAGYVLPPIPDLSQREVLAWVDELIRDVATGVNREWENPWLERYLEAMWAWLSDRPEPPPESLERRMIGHILSPPGVTSLADYLEAVRRRVESPADRWPSHLEMPQPPWGMVGVALRVARYYE